MKTELDKYLSEDGNEVDVQEWWKFNSHTFPTLSKIVQDVVVSVIKLLRSPFLVLTEEFLMHLRV